MTARNYQQSHCDSFIYVYIYFVCLYFCYNVQNCISNNHVYWKLSKSDHDMTMIVHELQDILHSEMWLLLGLSGQVYPVHHTQVFGQL